MKKGSRGVVGSGDLSDFDPIRSEADKRRTLVMTADTNCKAVLWFGHKAERLVLRSKVHMDCKMRESFDLEVPASLDLEQWLAEVKEARHSSCHVMIFTKEPGIIGFKSQLIEAKDGRIRLVLPDQIFRAQRRKNYRHIIHRGQDITVSICDPRDLRQRIRLPLLDVSVGGISLLVSSEVESLLYKEGMLIRHGFVKIRGRVINFDGEVRAIGKITDMPKVEGYRIGIKFRRISKDDLEFLDMYVIEHAIQYFHTPYKAGEYS